MDARTLYTNYCMAYNKHRGRKKVLEPWDQITDEATRQIWEDFAWRVNAVCDWEKQALLHKIRRSINRKVVSRMESASQRHKGVLRKVESDIAKTINKYLKGLDV